MKIKPRKSSGYVLPVAMAVMSILTFTMLGVMETSQVEEKKASNEQYRRLVEQVARSELKSQSEYLEKNKRLLRRSENSNLSANLAKNGCSSNTKEAICQTVTLNYLGDFPKSPQLQETIPKATFVGRRFRITSKAEHKRSGAVAEMSMDLRHAELEIWLRRDIPEALGTHPDRDELISLLKFYIPEWWEVKVLSPWRIGCVTPSSSPGAFLRGLFAALWPKTILFDTSCVVQYLDRQGIFRSWDSGTLRAGSVKVFVVPAGSRNVLYYWQANVAGRHAGYNGFWDSGIIRWWRMKQATWNLPIPVDVCHVAHGTSESPWYDGCPPGTVDDYVPIIGW